MKSYTITFFTGLLCTLSEIINAQCLGGNGGGWYCMLYFKTSAIQIRFFIFILKVHLTHSVDLYLSFS